MEEIGIPSVSLHPLIDISEMLNSPPPPPPVVRHNMKWSEGWQACRKEGVYRADWEVTAPSEWQSDVT